MRQFRQITRNAPEEMRAAAVIALSPAELATSQKIRFRKARDDLDSLRFALLELESGQIVGLLRHDGSPDPGTELHLPASTKRADAVVREALSALGLTKKDVTWARSPTKARRKKRQPVPA